MATLKALPNGKVINGFKGVIDFYLYLGIPVARSWPKSPGKNRSPLVSAQWPIFTTAANLWRQLSPEVVQAYEDMAKKTNLVAKDMFFRGYISGTLRYYQPPDALQESS